MLLLIEAQSMATRRVHDCQVGSSPYSPFTLTGTAHGRTAGAKQVQSRCKAGAHCTALIHTFGFCLRGVHSRLLAHYFLPALMELIWHTARTLKQCTTSPHACMQVLDDPIDVSRMLEHDVPVDIIVTPTRVRGRVSAVGAGCRC